MILVRSQFVECVQFVDKNDPPPFFFKCSILIVSANESCGLEYFSRSSLFYSAVYLIYSHTPYIHIGICCNLEAAEAIRRQLFADPTTSSSVFVAWEHANIGYLAESLMIDTMDDYEQQVIGSYLSTNPAFQEMMYWPDSNFDEILTMWFDPITQKFLKIDTDSYVQGFGD